MEISWESQKFINILQLCMCVGYINKEKKMSVYEGLNIHFIYTISRGCLYLIQAAERVLHLNT